MTDNGSAYIAKGHFSTVDYTIFIILILVSVAIGIVVGLKNWGKTTTRDFLVGGRKMHPIPVAMSLIGGVISALSVLGNATEMYFYGTQLWLNILGSLWGILVVIFLTLPTLYPLELISVMQYLELRFDSMILRKMGSMAQILSMALYLGICLYTPSLALSSVSTLPTWASILSLGLVCTFYISLGGVKAVVYTDVVQTTIMFIGILVVIIIVCTEIGGLGTVFSIAQEGGRLELFNFDPSPLIRHTFWSVQVLGLYFVVSVVGLSQPQFQRLNSVRSLKLSQLLCVMFYVGLVVLWSLFYLTGLVAYATYVDCDPLTSGQIEKPDQIIPFLVADKLSRFPGMAGLFVSAVYGAVLSSVSSSASAFAALVWEDFLRDSKWFHKNVCLSATDTTRLLSAFAGCMGIALAFLIGRLGTLFQAAYSIMGAFVGPLDGLFVSAIAAPWINEKGAIVGFVTAFVLNVWLIVGQFVNGAGQVSPLPLSTSGCSSEIMNLTLQNLEYEFTSNSTTSSFIPDLISGEELMIAESTKERDYLPIYDISYCYLGANGVVLVFIISSIVSLLTGPNEPDEIDEKLVHRPSLKIYRSIWNFFVQKKKLNIFEEKEANQSVEDSQKGPNHSIELKSISKPTKENICS